MGKTAAKRNSKTTTASAVGIANPAERFFDIAKARPTYCCTGAREALEALQLYSVNELLVARPACPPPRAAPMGQDFDGRTVSAEWQAWAAEHKAKLQFVHSDSAVGKKFCKGVGVAALLSRPIDDDLLDSMMESYHSEAPSPRHRNQRPQRQQQQRVLSAAPQRQEQQPSQVVARSAVPTQRAEFLRWLRGALAAELTDECTVNSLLDCAEVLLMPAEEDSRNQESVAAALQSAEEVLRDEGATLSAGELSARWYATMDP